MTLPGEGACSDAVPDHLIVLLLLLGIHLGQRGVPPLPPVGPVRRRLQEQRKRFVTPRVVLWSEYRVALLFRAVPLSPSVRRCQLRSMKRLGKGIGLMPPPALLLRSACMQISHNML